MKISRTKWKKLQKFAYVAGQVMGLLLSFAFLFVGAFVLTSLVVGLLCLMFKGFWLLAL